MKKRQREERKEELKDWQESKRAWNKAHPAEAMEKRMIVVTCCRDCPIESDCKECQDALDKNIPASCPLPKLPSVTAKFLFDLGFEIRRNFNFKYEAGNDSEIAKRLTVAFKSIGVEI